LTNYLALIGWSPGEGQELLPMEEMARRFRLDSVGHSAGVFDVEKLSWVNRHYLKTASPARLTRLALPYLQAAGWLQEPDAGQLAFLEQIIPVAAGAVDRLEQVPARLAFLFDYSAAKALDREAVLAEALASKAVIDTLADELALSAARGDGGALVDREAFRAMAARVKQRSGVKGKALFHPIRLALTGESEGLELDVAVPAIERGATVMPRIANAAARAAEFARLLVRA
jgi:glutamyl/glutaminyl-tRNA synthetase